MQAFILKAQKIEIFKKMIIYFKLDTQGHQEGSRYNKWPNLGIFGLHEHDILLPDLGTMTGETHLPTERDPVVKALLSPARASGSPGAPGKLSQPKQQQDGSGDYTAIGTTTHAE